MLTQTAGGTWAADCRGVELRSRVVMKSTYQHQSGNRHATTGGSRSTRIGFSAAAARSRGERSESGSKGSAVTTGHSQRHDATGSGALPGLDSPEPRRGDLPGNRPPNDSPKSRHEFTARSSERTSHRDATRNPRAERSSLKNKKGKESKNREQPSTNRGGS